MTGLSKTQLENWFTNNRKVNILIYFKLLKTSAFYNP